MDLKKKILALAMLALLTLPSFTMGVRADPGEDGAGLADAIERARLYLENVRTSAANLATEYPDNEDIQGYFNEINGLLGRYDGDYTEILLETNGDVGEGDEDRIVIPMPSDFTLGDLETLSWLVNTEYGYPPHVDITLDTVDSDQSMLTAELAVNNPSYSPPTYGTYDTWLETFEMALDDGYDEVDDTTVLWVTKMGAGDLDAPSSTLANWKLGNIDKDPGSELTTTEISFATPVLKLEIEVDNWIAQTKAYVDDIKINGDVYDFEEEEEEAGQAKDYLDQASAYLAEDEFNLAARNLAAARNILGRVKGLLNSMIKAQKVTRIERFMAQMRIRINSILDKIDKLSGRLDGNTASNVNAAMGNAMRNIPHMGDNPSDDDIGEVMDGLEVNTESIDAGMDETDEETSTILKAIDRLEVKIRVLKASADRLERKGADTLVIEEDLENAEAMLETIMDLHVEGKTDEAESLLEEAKNLVSEVSSEIRGIGKGHKGKGPKKDK